MKRVVYALISAMALAQDEVVTDQIVTDEATTELTSEVDGGTTDAVFWTETVAWD